MKRIAIFLTVFFLLLTSFPAKAKGVCVRCKKLALAGFPPSYQTSLCTLLERFPNFTFSPLPVTELSRGEGAEYTFSFVLEEEYKEDRSLVSAAETYVPYWDENEKIYDRGYRKASRAAISYFLDPRPHLTEKGIFQFLLLSYESVSADAVARVFENSALEGRVDPELILTVGRETGVSPLHLAVRLRQEQGRDGSPLLSGTAGEYLARLSGKEYSDLNGYYNPFHVKASGTGEFSVYENGALFAREKGWDSLEKGIFGGGEKLGEEYIRSYQNTLYLQKWNVDIRSRTPLGESRNFWAQYMQNVGAAKTEGDKLYQIYKEWELISFPLTFSIPIYEGLPEAESRDPGEGKVLSFAAAPAETACHQYEEKEVLWEESQRETTEKVTARVAVEKEKNRKTGIISLLFCILFCYFVRKMKKSR